MRSRLGRLLLFMPDTGDQIPTRAQSVRGAACDGGRNSVLAGARPERLSADRIEERRGREAEEHDGEKEGLHAPTVPRRARAGHFSDGLTRPALARMVRPQ